MSPMKMVRHVSDNPYLHKDFHGALSNAIEFLHRKYGDGSVRDYLRRFALAYYAPLRADLQRRGLIALREHWERIYRAEGGEVEFTLTPDELCLRVRACPAVQHLRIHHYDVATLFIETTRTVNQVICEGTAYDAQLEEYDPLTGRSLQVFYRRMR